MNRERLLFLRDRNQQLAWKYQKSGQREHKVAGVESGKERRHHQRGSEGSLESSDYQSFGRGDWDLVFDALLLPLCCILQLIPSHCAWCFPNLAQKSLNPGIHQATARAVIFLFSPLSQGRNPESVWPWELSDFPETMTIENSFLKWYKDQRIDMEYVYYRELGKTRSHFAKCLVVNKVQQSWWTEKVSGDSADGMTWAKSGK